MTSYVNVKDFKKNVSGGLTHFNGARPLSAAKALLADNQPGIGWAPPRIREWINSGTA